MNRELEAREMLRQIEEQRLEREQRDRAAEEARIRDEAARIAAENIRKYKGQNSSHNKLETEEKVFAEASGGDTRKSTRDRKQAEKYEAGA